MSVQNLRARIGARLNGDSEAGFTLIELLVVMLILGILAAIALPAFFNQKEKAGDAKAKETAHSTQVALETYATENGGSYVGATVTKLHKIEPTIPLDKESASEAGKFEGVVELPALATNGYTIKVNSTTGNWFEIVNAAGALTYPCEKESTGGCPSTKSWGNG
jgi:type IV pilus assembly protein PilA